MMVYFVFCFNVLALVVLVVEAVEIVSSHPYIRNLLTVAEADFCQVEEGKAGAISSFYYVCVGGGGRGE